MQFSYRLDSGELQALRRPVLSDIHCIGFDKEGFPVFIDQRFFFFQRLYITYEAEKIEKLREFVQEKLKEDLPEEVVTELREELDEESERDPKKASEKKVLQDALETRKKARSARMMSAEFCFDSSPYFICASPRLGAKVTSSRGVASRATAIRLASLFSPTSVWGMPPADVLPFLSGVAPHAVFPGLLYPSMNMIDGEKTIPYSLSSYRVNIIPRQQEELRRLQPASAGSTASVPPAEKGGQLARPARLAGEKRVQWKDEASDPDNVDLNDPPPKRPRQ